MCILKYIIWSERKLTILPPTTRLNKPIVTTTSHMYILNKEFCSLLAQHSTTSATSPGNPHKVKFRPVNWLASLQPNHNTINRYQPKLDHNRPLQRDNQWLLCYVAACTYEWNYPEKTTLTMALKKITKLAESFHHPPLSGRLSLHIACTKGKKH